MRDKDAVVTSMLIGEMAASARERGLTLHDLLLDLYARYGYAAEKTIAITLEGKEGIERIRQGMASLRSQKANGLPGLPVLAVSDYLEKNRLDLTTGAVSPLDLPESDVLVYDLGGLDWFCARPSGTEPKIKIYFGVYGPAAADCEDRLSWLVNQVEGQIRAIL